MFILFFKLLTLKSKCMKSCSIKILYLLTQKLIV